MNRNTSEIIYGFSQGNSVPETLDACPPLIPNKFSIKEDNSPDLLVLAEFNEIEGPTPILTIPKDGVPYIDVNDFVVKLLSTDYQNAGCGEFEITRDTSLLQHDDKYGLFFYAQYFTLFDTRARGFVRPMCVAYISKSKKKLMTYYRNLADEFRNAIEYLRVSNLHCFLKETESRLKDLTYTKEWYLKLYENQTDSEENESDHLDSKLKESERRESVYAKLNDELSPISREVLNLVPFPPSSSPIDEEAIRISSVMFDNSMDEESLDVQQRLSVLQHTNLESIATQMIDAKTGLHVIQDYLDNSPIRTELESLESYLKDKYHCPLYPIAKNYLQAASLESETNHVPSIFVLALMRRCPNNMRNIKTLGGVGYIIFVSKVLEIYKKYSKSLTTLFFNELDKDFINSPNGSLFIGNIPSIHLTNVQCKKDQEWSTKNLEDDELIELLKNVDLSSKDKSISRSGPIEEDCLSAFKAASSPSLETQRSVLDKPPRMEMDPEENLSDKRFIKTINNNCTSSGEQYEIKCDSKSEHYDNTPFQNISDRMETTDLSGVLKKFSEVSQCIINSVLSGRPLIVSGPAIMKNTVKSYIKGLSTILPVDPSSENPILMWHTGTITEHHLKLHKIIGLCIPERLHAQDLLSNASLNKVTLLNVETGHISGVAYGGRLLNQVESICNTVLQKGHNYALQTSVQSMLVSHGLQVYLLHHLLDVTSKTPDEVLKGICIPRRDWESIKYLKHIVSEQVKLYERL